MLADVKSWVRGLISAQATFIVSDEVLQVSCLENASRMVDDGEDIVSTYNQHQPSIRVQMDDWWSLVTHVNGRVLVWWKCWLAGDPDLRSLVARLPSFRWRCRGHSKQRYDCKRENKPDQLVTRGELDCLLSIFQTATSCSRVEVCVHDHLIRCHKNWHLIPRHFYCLQFS